MKSPDDDRPAGSVFAQETGGMMRYAWRYGAGYAAICLLLLVLLVAYEVASGTLVTGLDGSHAIKDMKSVSFGLVGFITPSLLACYWPLMRFFKDRGRLPDSSEVPRLFRSSVAASVLAWFPAICIVVVSIAGQGDSLLISLVVLVPFALHAIAIRAVYAVSALMSEAAAPRVRKLGATHSTTTGGAQEDSERHDGSR